MMSCKEAARLLSEQKDHKLPLGKRIELKFHLGMCRVCRIYERQMQWLSRMANRAGELVMGNTAGPELSPEAKERIKRKLSETE